MTGQPYEENDAVDLLIIGAGQAGCAAALRASELGLKTAIVEQRLAGPGGAFVHEDGLPFGVLWSFAKKSRDGQTAESESGGGAASGRSVDLSTIHLSDVVAKGSEAKRQSLLRQGEVRFYEGRGYLASTGSVVVLHPETGDELHGIDARNILVSTGSIAVPRDGFEPEGRALLMGTELLFRSELPDSLVILGEGRRACNMALLFAQLGSRVTVLSDSPRLLPEADAAVSDFVERELDALGCRLLLDESFAGAEVIEESGEVVVTTGNGEEIFSLCAADCGEKHPASRRLGLKKLNVQLSPDDGGVTVDRNLQTHTPHIFAAGSVLGGGVPPEQARLEGVFVAEHVAGIKATLPPDHFPGGSMALAAWVGLSEEEARNRNGEVGIGYASFDENLSAVLEEDATGFVKVIADRGTGEILGVHVAGSSANEIVGAATLAMRFEYTVSDLARMGAPIPSRMEALEAAAAAVSTRRRSG